MKWFEERINRVAEYAKKSFGEDVSGGVALVDSPAPVVANTEKNNYDIETVVTTDAVDLSTGAEMIRTPQNAGSISLDWTGDRLKASLTVRAEGEQADSDPSTFSPAKRDGFTVADLRGGWALTDRLDLTVRVVNLTDETWQQSLGYGEAGRGVFVGLRLRN